jgi:hypothetical protein
MRFPPAPVHGADDPAIPPRLRNRIARGRLRLWDTMTNELQEFWPDIRRGVYRPTNTGDER